MSERNNIILRLVSTHIIMPLILCIAPFFINASFLLFSIAQSVIIILFLSGYWEFYGVSFRNIFISSLEIISVLIFINRIYFIPKIPSNFYLLAALALIQGYLVIQIIRIILVIFIRKKNSLEIAFPFHDGLFLITDGGDSKISRLMNYHYYSPLHMKNNTNRSMSFAVDIVKLNKGKGSVPFLSRDNEDYFIFSENIYAPMDGEVFIVVNDTPDSPPFSGNYPYNTGNSVVIRNGDLFY